MFSECPVVGDLFVIGGSKKKNDTYVATPQLRRDTLSVVINGKISVDYSAGKITACEGDILYIPCNTASTTVFEDENNRFFNFIFKINKGAISEKPVVIKSNGTANATVKKAVELYNAKTGTDAEYYSLFYMLIHQLSFDIRQSDVFPAVEYIEKYPERNKTVKEYAEMCMMCETSFRKSFRECTGFSPCEYRIKKRTETVRNLVYLGESKENAIAAAGFSTPSFYYRCLRNRKFT